MFLLPLNSCVFMQSGEIWRTNYFGRRECFKLISSATSHPFRALARSNKRQMIFSAKYSLLEAVHLVVNDHNPLKRSFDDMFKGKQLTKPCVHWLRNCLSCLLSERWLVAFTNALCETRGGSWVCETGSCKAVACVVKFRWVNFFGLRTASPKKLTATISALEKFRITKAARVVSERFLEWGICVKCSLILHCQTNYSRVENAYLVYSAGILSSLNQTEQCRHERALPRLMLIDIP